MLESLSGWTHLGLKAVALQRCVEPAVESPLISGRVEVAAFQLRFEFLL